MKKFLVMTVCGQSVIHLLARFWWQKIDIPLFAASLALRISETWWSRLLTLACTGAAQSAHKDG
jgi:hypothetical protein